MNHEEIEACVRLVHLMEERPLFKPLNGEDIDFSIVIDALNNNLYRSVDDWAEAISYSWRSKLESYSKTSIEYIFASDQDKWFRKHVLKIPHSKIDEWKLELAKVTKEFAELCRMNPQNPANGLKKEEKDEVD